MLSNKTIEIVKSTVPVLVEHGQAITTRFYTLLFENHPELLNIFNHANQKQGRQQIALAHAVLAAAAHIDHLEEILPDVKLISNKHRSLGIEPEQYPIVGENLLAAIKDVLGDAATDEILTAWGEAYQEIANVFIQIEKDLYYQAESQPGGWAGFRNFVISKKVKESDVITSFYLKPEDGRSIASFIPGQYISIKLLTADGNYTQIRQYSLSDSSGHDYYRISVKREADGENKPAGEISNLLHDQKNEGDLIPISAPAGVFTLNENEKSPVVLLSGGVGITPMLSMLNTLVEKHSDRKVTFIHAALNSKTHAFRQHVQDLEKKHEQLDVYFCYSQPTEEDRKENRFDKEGYVTFDWLKEILPRTIGDFYFCGPVPFMKEVYGAVKQLGVQESRIHYEFFGPSGELEVHVEKDALFS